MPTNLVRVQSELANEGRVKPADLPPGLIQHLHEHEDATFGSDSIECRT